MLPAIVVPAYNRPDALARLLASLETANVPTGTTLVIAIDRAAKTEHKPGNEAVLQAARRFEWTHGPKEIIDHPDHLGLVGNVFYCGSLAESFGAIILLEDDLIVSRRFYDYAQQALACYASEQHLAGISLNALWFNGFTHQPFIPLPDDGDVFFLQLSTPQGQVYTAAQWLDFANWTAVHGYQVTALDNVHELFASFPADDWLAIKAKYLSSTDKYYVYPRESLTTNFGDPGTHFTHRTALFQVPLQQLRREFRFLPFEQAIAVYDGFYELIPERLGRMVEAVRDLSLDVDLYASKAPHQLRAEYTLTTRPCRRPLVTFARELRPMEANVIAGLTGEGIYLARREDVETGHEASRRAQQANDRYFNRRTPRAMGNGERIHEWLRQRMRRK